MKEQKINRVNLARAIGLLKGILGLLLFIAYLLGCWIVSNLFFYTTSSLISGLVVGAVICVPLLFLVDWIDDKLYKFASKNKKL